MTKEEKELLLQDHWQDVREHAAISALQGVLANSNRLGNIDDITQFAVDCADALIEKLKN